MRDPNTRSPQSCQQGKQLLNLLLEKVTMEHGRRHVARRPQWMGKVSVLLDRMARWKLELSYGALCIDEKNATRKL